MESLCPLWILLLAGAGLFGALLVGIGVLIKLGVIVNYAARQEEPDQADYNLDESREVKD